MINYSMCLALKSHGNMASKDTYGNTRLPSPTERSRPRLGLPRCKRALDLADPQRCPEPLDVGKGKPQMRDDRGFVAQNT